MSYKEAAEELFGVCSSFHEAAYEWPADFTCKADNLPQYDVLVAFVSEIEDRDSLTLEMKSVEEFSYKSPDRALWQQSYETFLSNCEKEDEIRTTLHIQKQFQEDVISIYCFDAFVEYLRGLSISKQAKFFSVLFNGDSKTDGHIQIRFDLHDTEFTATTDTMQFCKNSIVIASEPHNRNLCRKKYSEGSLFFSQNEYGLSPDDFSILEKHRTVTSTETDGICPEEESAGLLRAIFARLETIFSYAYLAHTCQIVGDDIVLQFDPSNSGFVISLDSVNNNRFVCDIFKWAFHCENVVERASIARNVIAIRCKSPKDLLNIDGNIHGSVISNFNIYQKSSTEKYIETKNKISDLIIEASKQVQELTHDLVEGLRNNFIAMSMFLLTTLLTDSIDVEDVIQGETLSSELVFVLNIFVVFSGAYLIVTYISAIFKWQMFKRGYNQLRENYSGLLDEVDLKEAFSHGDDSVRKTRNSILITGAVIFLIWIGCLVWLYGSIHQIEWLGLISRIFGGEGSTASDIP